MLRHVFEEIWGTEKSIVEVIRFRLNLCISKRYEFDAVEILGHPQYDLKVNGVYHCGTGEITFNFMVVDVGTVCRYDLGGAEHGEAGRFHQHLVKKPDCVRRQLPNAVPRNDLMGLTCLQAWKKVCDDASIYHHETFFEPELLC